MYKNIITTQPYTSHIIIVKDGQEIASFRGGYIMGQINTNLVKSIRTSHDDIRREEIVVVEV